MTGAVTKNMARIIDAHGTSLTISVIILNWNGCALTLGCIDSVIRHAGDVAYEIIVIDNGSDEADLALLKSKIAPSVRLISLNENLYFGEANNIAAEAASGKFILLLNNDVVIQEGAITKLLQVFQDEPLTGAAGPRLLYPDGRVQEAGAFILPSGWTFQQGKGGIPFDDQFRRGNHPVDYCSAACLLMRRDVFLSVGGFDPLFDPAYFEDADLALRLRSIGLYTYFCADAEVVHHESITSSKVWSSSGRKDVVIENHRKFLGRWASYLKTRMTSGTGLPDFQPFVHNSDEQNSPESGRRVLLCASRPIGLSDESEKLLRIAAALNPKYNITFAAPEACSKSRVYSLNHRFGLQLQNFHIIRFSAAVFDDYDRVILGHGWDNWRNESVPARSLFASDLSWSLLATL